VDAMSFEKYMQSRNQQKIIVDMEKYKENLHAELSSFAIKQNKNVFEVRKRFIDNEYFRSVFSKINYPYQEKFIIALNSNDFVKISKEQDRFSIWVENFCDDKLMSEKINEKVYRYQVNIEKPNLESDEVDEIYKNYLKESELILNQMSQDLRIAAEHTKNWKNHQITVEAIFPTEYFVVCEAKVTIGEKFNESFIYEKTPIGNVVKGLIKESSLSEKMRMDIQNFIFQLKNKPKYEKFVQLYISSPISERKKYENIKRDLALGMDSTLPNNIILSNKYFLSEDDLWKIKIDKRFLQEFICEGDFIQYKIISDNASIRCIEKVENEK
jgi:predicted RNA-binding protein Jag